MTGETTVVVTVREASLDDHIIVECPGCTDPMLLGESWRELILEDDYDVPPCPDCDDESGDSWRDDADPKIDAVEYWALSGDVIRTVEQAPAPEPNRPASGGDSDR